jgi:WD repeat-containing protein 76
MTRGSKGYKSPEVIAEHYVGKSINSAYFSPSGHHVLATTQMNTLDILDDFHLAKDKVKPRTRVKHDNMTGRWLSTFHAVWHPALDMFVVGSMQKPRAIELFDAQGSLLRNVSGDALTAVASRCCFHPRTDNLLGRTTRIEMAFGLNNGARSMKVGVK